MAVHIHSDILRTNHYLRQYRRIGSDASLNLKCIPTLRKDWPPSWYLTWTSIKGELRQMTVAKNGKQSLWTVSLAELVTFARLNDCDDCDPLGSACHSPYPYEHVLCIDVCHLSKADFIGLLCCLIYAAEEHLEVKNGRYTIKTQPFFLWLPAVGLILIQGKENIAKVAGKCGWSRLPQAWINWEEKHTCDSGADLTVLCRNPNCRHMYQHLGEEMQRQHLERIPEYMGGKAKRIESFPLLMA